MVAADKTTVEYLRGRRYLPTGKESTRSRRGGSKCRSDDGAKFDRSVVFDAGDVRAAGDVGHEIPGWSPTCAAACRIPPRLATRNSARPSSGRSLIWRCGRGRKSRTSKTDSRLYRIVHQLAAERSQSAAGIVKGHKVAPTVHAMVVPGSQEVKAEAESLGLDRVFTEAGFEWRESGCSMCLAMNPDVLQPGERCASTSESQLRGASGQGRTDAPGESRDGGSGGDRRAFRRCARVGESITERQRCRSSKKFYRDGGAARSRQRRYRSDHSEAVSQGCSCGPVSRLGCLSTGGAIRTAARTRISC